MGQQDDINQIIDWLEGLSQRAGYDEARQFRRDIVDAMGEEGVSWDGLSETIIAEGVSTWLGRTRSGGVTFAALPSEMMADCVRQIRIALSQHATDINRPATLSVEEFGDGLQAVWSVLRGPNGAEEAQPDPQTNGVPLRADFKLGR